MDAIKHGVRCANGCQHLDHVRAVNGRYRGDWIEGIHRAPPGQKRALMGCPALLKPESRVHFVARATSVNSADDFGLVAVLRIKMSGGNTLLRP